MVDHCAINEFPSEVIVKRSVLSLNQRGIIVHLALEVSMMRPIPFPILLADRQPHIVRAHRMRSAVVANLIRDFARWVSAAAR
jgi:branched-subunit amino acid transport protein AzlD